MSQPASIPSIRHSCPGCHQPGRAVSAVTVESLVVPERVARLVSTVGFQFCPTPECAVAYFNPLSGEVVPQREVRVAIFQKGGDPQRLVCYCFGRTVEAVQREARETGSSRIMGDIRAKCAQGLDACERTNPQGSCCLGNVQRLVRETQTRPGPSATGGCCCCEGD